MTSSSSYKLKKGFINSVLHVILAVLSVAWVLPVVWLILQSFRAEKGAFISYIIPKTWTLNNYVKLFTDVKLFNFPQWFLNTFIVAVFSCIITTVLVLLTSYAFSRLRFKARKPLMNIILILGMFPGFMSMIAIYHILKSFGLTQTLFALVLVYSGGAAMGYYIAKGFFDTVPRSIDEAALVDGCTKNQVFWNIILPMSKPVVVYTILTSFIGPWVDFIFVSVIMKDAYNKYTVALGLYQMLSRENIYNYFTEFCAGAVIVAIPITILFISMQKYYVSGVTAGGAKG
ncbi:sugar ABC transporter permease [Mageeibacillus indolicus]|uniref:ABC transporter, permease protein n=1 Tax=Mageeibacillus indolicus (strain UPII9-5) TaxID=699246 RepID=D3R018_MAGIU|nr:sugar ABC transporter permease [Mageeibacillus indolicus]ADC91584.1 ABC transporter, permease protein [Mageeibacillus indolicus UPII9-5]KFA57068.1 sugar ABC transporter permease [Mageeibacillus indolicus 0009-5]